MVERCICWKARGVVDFQKKAPVLIVDQKIETEQLEAHVVRRL